MTAHNKSPGNEAGATPEQALIRRLEENARRKDEWIAMLGHELRNPVGTISNAIELLREDALTPARRAAVVELMRRQTRQIGRLLNDLLDASQILSGKLHVELAPMDLSQIAQWTVEAMRPVFDAAGHELVVDLPPAGTVCVRGDETRLTEVLVNLLTNASRYTPAGGRIRLEIAADGDEARIAVTDNGIGIPPDLLERIFEMFAQGRRALQHADRGLGLGLTLVRTLVDLHGGRVEAHSDGPDTGSRFVVMLPRLRADAEPRA